MDIPSLFYYNAFNVISDGLDTHIGTITSDFTRYMAWKLENGEQPAEEGINYFETLLNGVFPKERLLDIIRNFIMFKESESKTIKILADEAHRSQYGLDGKVDRETGTRKNRQGHICGHR